MAPVASFHFFEVGLIFCCEIFPRQISLHFKLNCPSGFGESLKRGRLA